MNIEEMLAKMRDSEMLYLDMKRLTREYIEEKNWTRAIDVLTMMMKLDGKDISKYVNSSVDVVNAGSSTQNIVEKLSEPVLKPTSELQFDMANDIPKVNVETTNYYSMSTTELDNYILDFLWKQDEYFSHFDKLNASIKSEFGNKFNSHDLKTVATKPYRTLWETRTFDRAAELKKKQLIDSRGKGYYQLTPKYIKSRIEEEQKKNAQITMKY